MYTEIHMRVLSTRAGRGGKLGDGKEGRRGGSWEMGRKGGEGEGKVEVWGAGQGRARGRGSFSLPKSVCHYVTMNTTWNIAYGHMTLLPQ